MSFNFVNMNDAALASLISAAREERQRRFIANVSKFPRPVVTNGGLEDVKRYYHVYKDSHNIGLLEAKMIVDHWNKAIMGDQES